MSGNSDIKMDDNSENETSRSIRAPRQASQKEELKECHVSAARTVEGERAKESRSGRGSRSVLCCYCCCRCACACRYN